MKCSNIVNHPNEPLITKDLWLRVRVTWERVLDLLWTKEGEGIKLNTHSNWSNGHIDYWNQINLNDWSILVIGWYRQDNLCSDQLLNCGTYHLSSISRQSVFQYNIIYIVLTWTKLQSLQQALVCLLAGKTQQTSGWSGNVANSGFKGDCHWNSWSNEQAATRQIIMPKKQHLEALSMKVRPCPKLQQKNFITVP